MPSKIGFVLKAAALKYFVSSADIPSVTPVEPVANSLYSLR